MRSLHVVDYLATGHRMAPTGTRPARPGAHRRPPLPLRARRLLPTRPRRDPRARLRPAGPGPHVPRHPAGHRPLAGRTSSTSATRHSINPTDSTQLAATLHPGGVFALWSDDPPEEQLHGHRCKKSSPPASPTWSAFTTRSRTATPPAPSTSPGPPSNHHHDRKRTPPRHHRRPPAGLPPLHAHHHDVRRRPDRRPVSATTPPTIACSSKASSAPPRSSTSTTSPPSPIPPAKPPTAAPPSSIFDDQPPAIDETHALLADKTALAGLKIPDPLGGGRMHDRRQGASRCSKRQVGGEKLVEGWIEGPCAEAADLRGINTLMLDFYDDPAFVRDLFEFIVEMALRFARGPGRRRAPTSSGWATPPRPSSARTSTRSSSGPTRRSSSTASTPWAPAARLHICGNTSQILEGMGRLGCAIVDLDSMAPLAEARAAMGPGPGPRSATSTPSPSCGTGPRSHPRRDRRLPPPGRRPLHRRRRLRSPARHARRKPQRHARFRPEPNALTPDGAGFIPALAAHFNAPAAVCVTGVIRSKAAINRRTPGPPRGKWPFIRPLQSLWWGVRNSLPCPLPPILPTPTSWRSRPPLGLSRATTASIGGSSTRPPSSAGWFLPILPGKSSGSA